MVIFNLIKIELVTLKSEATRLVLNNAPLKAIKLVRDTRKCGLIEAKDYVDRIRFKRGKMQDYEAEIYISKGK